MQFESKKSGNVTIVSILESRVDAKIAVDFRDSIADLINSGNHNLVVDLSEVDFVDSSGLGAIVSSLKILGRKGDMALSGVRPTVMSLFKLTRMDKVFRMFDDEAEAAKALAE
ncbi:MAG: STAS domain-containing protein [bacterium]